MSRKDLKKNTKTTTPKKMCLICGKEKMVNHFYKANDLNTFPDGRYHTCSSCVKDNTDDQNLQKIHSLLAELNRPFIRVLWKKALSANGVTIAEYLKMVSGNSQYADMTYQDGDDVIRLEDKVEVVSQHVYDKKGYAITLTDDIRQKWHMRNNLFSDQDIMRLEQMFVNMSYDFAIETTMETQALEKICVLEVEAQKRLNEGDDAAYKRLSDSLDTIMKSSGLRPIDKKNDGILKKMDSLGEVIAHIERNNGFIPPDRINYPPDDIDRMLSYYVNWAQQFNDAEVSVEINHDWREEVDDDNINFTVSSSENADYAEVEEDENEDEI